MRLGDQPAGSDPVAGRLRRRLLACAAGVILLAAGFGAGWSVRGAGERRGQPSAGAPAARLIHGKGDQPWRFVNPLLECEASEDLLLAPELDLMRKRIRDFVRQSRGEGRILEASVFFREMREGAWFGIGMRRAYTPASLAKLPILISVLRRAETEPDLLRRTLLFDRALDKNELMFFKPAVALEPGRRYSVEELCRRMVRESDNNAADLLFELVTPQGLEQTLRGLNLFSELQFTGGYMSVRSVSAIFRVLYNASYLTPEMSELALEMLSHASFRGGLVAGVPPGVTVCSKYAESIPEPGVNQLHEFALVYHGDRPYLLGIMTRGRDYPGMQRFLVEASRLIYGEVESAALRRQSSPLEPGAFVDRNGLRGDDE